MNEDPYETPMMIYPAIHYTMGGIWVDYELMTSIPVYCHRRSQFSDHGANRLGASALMQGLADGYFILPYTMQTTLPIRFRYRDSIPIAPNSRKRKKTSKNVLPTDAYQWETFGRLFP